MCMGSRKGSPGCGGIVSRLRLGRLRRAPWALWPTVPCSLWEHLRPRRRKWCRQAPFPHLLQQVQQLSPFRRANLPLRWEMFLRLLRQEFPRRRDHLRSLRRAHQFWWLQRWSRSLLRQERWTRRSQLCLAPYWWSPLGRRGWRRLPAPGALLSPLRRRRMCRWLSGRRA